VRLYVTPHSNISEQSHSRILETRTFVTQLAISAKDLQRSQRWNKTKAFRPPMTSAKAPNCLKPILKLEPWHIMASCDLCTAFNGHTSAAKMLGYKISYQSRTIWHCKDRFGSHVLRGNRWATTKATIPSHQKYWLVHLWVHRISKGSSNHLWESTNQDLFSGLMFH